MVPIFAALSITTSSPRKTVEGFDQLLVRRSLRYWSKARDLQGVVLGNGVASFERHVFLKHAVIPSHVNLCTLILSFEFYMPIKTKRTTQLTTVPWDIGASAKHSAPKKPRPIDEKELSDDNGKTIGSSPPSSDQDIAANSSISESRLLRKLDFHLLPGVCILYLLSFLDRSNVANAKLEGLTEDLRMTDNQYLTGLTLFFVGYILLEVLWNVILKRIGPRLWLPTLTLAFGIVSTLQGVVQYNGPGTGVAGFFVVRLFLGLTEGGLFPGVVFYLSMWYKRAERQYRIALFFAMASLAGAFGGILAYGIGFMDGVAGQRGWRWIFIIEGIATCVFAVAGFWYIADWPSKAKFISEDEKAYITARLKDDSDATQNEGFTWGNVWEAFKDPKVWLYNLVFHTLSLPLYTLSLFLVSITSSFSFENILMPFFV